MLNNKQTSPKESFYSIKIKFNSSVQICFSFINSVVQKQMEIIFQKWSFYLSYSLKN